MKKKYITIILIIILLTNSISFSHSGKTDSNGGHYDSSTGEYHYHHGYSAHQHTNGICPYQSNPSINDSETDYYISPIDTSVPTKTYTEDEYVKLQNIVYAKQASINRLNNTIIQKDTQIQNLQDKYIITIIVFIIILLSMYIYLSNKNTKDT